MATKVRVCAPADVLLQFERDVVARTRDSLSWTWSKDLEGVIVCEVDGLLFPFFPVVKVQLTLQNLQHPFASNSKVAREVRIAKAAEQNFKKAHCPLLFVTPRLNDRLLAACRRQRLSCLDLNGRVYLHHTGLRVELPAFQKKFAGFVQRRVFTPKSCRLARALLSSVGRLWDMRQLAAEAELSLGAVQYQLLYYQRQEWVNGDRGDWRILPSEASRLLSAWLDADRWHARVSESHYQHSGAVPDWESFCGRILSRLGRDLPIAFTKSVGRALRMDNADVSEITFYTRQIFTPEHAAALSLLPAAEEGQVVVLTPRDAGVCSNGRSVRGLPICSDAQIYLDLFAGDSDVAEAFKAWAGFMK